jgi:hypothetical protein
MSFSTRAERSVPIIVAWMSSRCDASTVKWTVVLSFRESGGADGLGAERLRGLAGGGSSDMAGLRLAVEPAAATAAGAGPTLIGPGVQAP